MYALKETAWSRCTTGEVFCINAIYKVELLDQQGGRIGTLHYPHSANQLIDPILSRGVNRAGSLKFSIPYTHEFYSSVLFMQCYIRVYRFGFAIFECRPTQIVEKMVSRM